MGVGAHREDFRSRSPASVNGTPTKSTLVHVTWQDRGREVPLWDRHLDREPAARIVIHGWFVLTQAGIFVTSLSSLSHRSMLPRS